MLIAAIVLAVVAVGLLLWGGVAYNGLVKVKNQVEAAWAQIEVQLNRRHDLIPNLVETVKGYATHEQETLERVVQARNAAVAATSPSAQAAAETAVSGALANVLALAEAYPDLKANAGFLDLQSQLAETEDRIAYARQYYNDSVKTYNTRIETVPTVVLARAVGYGPREYFQAEGTARGPVEVDL